jgi:NADH-quinone oxidoreductase subunit L
MVSELPESTLLRLIPLLPLAAALFHGILLAVVRRPLSRGPVIAISCLSVLAAFLVTCASLWELIGLEEGQRFLVDRVYTWVGVGAGNGSFSADLAFQFDSLSAVMCMVVTGVGLLIHLYAVGYMDEDHRDDKGFQRFFCYLNLFLSAMLMLVLGDNLLVMFLGWEGVGLCSYLLIGFWYSDEFNAYCGSKAFIVNRIGDAGFLVGIFLLFWSLAEAGVPAVSFRGIEAGFDKIVDMTVTLPAWIPGLGGAVWGLPNLIGLCFFLGACGKSAQLPLYVWLPDAMAGPTPVSALIHAATMVTAGVYMVCRLSFLYAAAPGASAVVAWVGALTAIFSATIAITQTDIKKVLAYSTVSQLGYMFLAAGCGAYTVAMFHVVTHAFFKALLFLGAGAVIIAMHHEQDMQKMGGLRSKLPNTHVVMAIAVLAIAGFPGFSGFFSKDEILLSAFLAHDVPGHYALWAIGVITAVITAFYMSRLLFLTFYGTSRVEAGVRSHLREPVAWVMWPLYILAALSVLGGFMGLPQFWGDMFNIPESDSLGNFLALTVVAAPHHEIAHSTELWLIATAIAAALLGLAVGYWLYVSRPDLPERLAARFAGIYRTLLEKYYVDEFYDRSVVRPLVALSDRILFRGVDAGLIDGIAVDGSARTVRAVAAHGLKYLQSGLAQGYLFLMIVGTVAIMAYLLG